MLASFAVRGDRWKTEGDGAGFLGFFSLLYLAYVAAIPSHTHILRMAGLVTPRFFPLADVEAPF